MDNYNIPLFASEAVVSTTGDAVLADGDGVSDVRCYGLAEWTGGDNTTNVLVVLETSADGVAYFPVVEPFDVPVDTAFGGVFGDGITFFLPYVRARSVITGTAPSACSVTCVLGSRGRLVAR